MLKSRIAAAVFEAAIYLAVERAWGPATLSSNMACLWFGGRAAVARHGVDTGTRSF